MVPVMTSSSPQDSALFPPGIASGASSGICALREDGRLCKHADYQRVYKDYSAAVEEVMSQEGVPPGYRYFVKRYFKLIRPRE